MSKCAFITGITGQDGAYLAELLVSKGYRVHGLSRRLTEEAFWRLDYLLGENWRDQIEIHLGDMTDAAHLTALLQQIKPDEIYNLAGQTYVWDSFNRPIYTGEVDAIGVTNILEAIRISELSNTVKFYQASTSEIYGNTEISSQNEETPFAPVSPYGAAKLYGYWMTRQYRENYGMFACNGILFNHESPLRDTGFVTRKIIKSLVRIKHGHQKTLKLGNLEAQRDWGHARDYVRGMWQMLQHNIADDYVLASGMTHSVKAFLDKACAKLDLNPDDVVEIDQNLMRPKDIDVLCGDASKAKQVLGWQPKHTLETLIDEMIEYETHLINR